MTSSKLSNLQKPLIPNKAPSWRTREDGVRNSTPFGRTAFRPQESQQHVMHHEDVERQV